MADNANGETLLSSTPLARGGLVLPELLAGRYQLLDSLGEGGMGLVVGAVDLDLEETVAIKFLRPELAADAELRARFRREVKLARRVTHANVARIFEFGHDELHCWLTMEFVPGESLQVLLAREAPLAPARALQLAFDLVAGLAAAHHAGVVHGDIKPSNILVAPGRGAVLTDFGIAQALVDSDGDGDGVRGTPLYMAPEQARGEPMSAATDIYAVGEVLYEALTGASLWVMEDMPTLLAHKRDGHEPELSAIFTRLPPAWTRLLVDCLRSRPEQRPHDARALLARMLAIRAVDDPGELAPQPSITPPTPGKGHPWIAVTPLLAPTELAWVGVGLVDALARMRGLRVVPGSRITGSDGPRLAARVSGEARPTATGVAVTLRVADPDDEVIHSTLEHEQPRTKLHLLGSELAASIADTIHTGEVTPIGDDPLDEDLSELFVTARHAYLTLQTDRAERLFAAAHARCPANPQIALWHTLARVQAALTFRDVDPGTLADLQREVEAALTSHGELGEPHLALARLRLALGDTPGCARALTAAIRRAPSLIEAHALLGDLLISIGRLPDAERRLDIAVMLDHGSVRAWLARARLWAYQGRWDEFYERAEPALSGLRFRTPLLIRLLLWHPRPAVLERYEALLADNRESLPAPIWRVARDLVAFGLARDDPRAIADRIAAGFTGAANPRLSGVFSQIVCELHCRLGDPTRALAYLELADRSGLTDWLWIEHCPVLAPLRDLPQVTATRGRVRLRADAVADAIWG